LNVNLQLALWWLEPGNFGYERRQNNQTWGHLKDWMLTNCLNHYVPRNGCGIQQNLFRLIANRQFAFWTLDAAQLRIVSRQRYIIHFMGALHGRFKGSA